MIRMKIAVAVSTALMASAMICGCGNNNDADNGTIAVTDLASAADTESENLEKQLDYNTQLFIGAFGADHDAVQQTVKALAAEGCGKIATINNISGTSQQYTMDIKDTDGRTFTCQINADGSLVKVNTTQNGTNRGE